MDFSSLVQELGIDKMPEDQQQRVLTNILNTLEMRVSLRMAQEMTDEQKHQIEQFSMEGDETSLEELERVYPNFLKVYQEEIDAMKADMLDVMVPESDGQQPPQQ